ncbi:MAG: starch-binding outer membrane protein SusD/RagB family [Anaerophaga sp.]|uniref:RagB/SusD family nutrient uptake outer membrane protein n=1 Tax=Anaerophaga thermohalophila TaxID=177400 RepID=UPI000237C850|nr:RagB/SusD family nutrient uptake outer membrane protein [Anaerophaga thermohalophila]MDI3520681.1 starch-binding outer membrane protein SusD/RagB family [Anaerophaga sp.]MDK2841214.1 starch-binding outer membrane protein SusD/RagB family [Anaerophaga sp.]MDN5290763.1 starch-binding outer membrane protein SusD/RagB family [Anaerophaga sp.]
MIKYIKTVAFAALIGLTSCGEDFLTAYPTASQEAGGEATKGAIEANVASAYQILLFDSYADYQYNSIVLMSDLRSDDIFKGGGDAGDQAQLYRLSQLDASPRELPGGLWNIYYSGLSRANNAIIACENAVDVNEEDLNRLSAEAHFLRAYYVHWLWKFWGNIPYFEEDLEDPYMAPQYTADQIYTELIEDLDYAIEGEKLPMSVDAAEEGRATRAAAMMLKARVVMYQQDQERYDEVLADMAKIINSGAYDLMDNYASLWPREGEFCDESIFEVNHLPEGKDWGAAWQGYGTNLPAFISPNELNGVDLLSGLDIYKGGWGFGPVRPEIPGIFETGDERLAASVNQFEEGTYTKRFQDTGLFMAKYAAREGYNEAPYTVDLNYENNLRIFRYAETLLNAAELMAMHGVTPVEGITAQWCLDEVRKRSLNDNFVSIPANEENIKLERRREFIGEGMRFWDLVRWGDAEILTEDIPEFSTQRSWEPYKKYLPIPQSEIDRTEGDFKLQQNPGYN